ncbi:MAG: DUF2480 family protein [Bacteroidetes bacterium]|nr:DUF2480 family protein [Bacteroidota bacterium]
MSENQIVNRVAQSSLVTLNLEDYYHPGPRVVYDLKEHLFQGLILREKDFRDSLKQEDWSKYKDQNVAVICSADAIIPQWAYMLIAVHLEPYANMVVFGDLQALEQTLFQKALASIDLDLFKDAKIVIKGCGEIPIPEFAYVEISRLLRPVAASIMYGEPCSTVPIYRKSRK